MKKQHTNEFMIQFISKTKRVRKEGKDIITTYVVDCEKEQEKLVRYFKHVYEGNWEIYANCIVSLD